MQTPEKVIKLENNAVLVYSTHGASDLMYRATFRDAPVLGAGDSPTEAVHSLIESLRKIADKLESKVKEECEIRDCWAIVDYEETLLIVRVGKIWPNGNVCSDDFVVGTKRDFDKNKALWSEFNDWQFTECPYSGRNSTSND